MPTDRRSERADGTPTPGDLRAPVLVAVDFSPDAEAALCWAARYASGLGLPLLVLHVVHDPAEAPGYYARVARSPVERLDDVARSMLDDFLEQVGRSEPALQSLARLEARTVVGIPEGRILEVAEHEGAQLIVMGGRGRSRLADILLGSKTERVARLAPMPVAIIKRERSRS
jgi:nucleotide-binding universal stress UspA family protein